MLRRILDTASLIVRTSRWLLLAVIVCQLADALSSVAIAYVAKRLVDAVVTSTQGGASQPLFWVGLEGLFVILRVLSTHASNYVQIVLRARFSLRASQLVLEKACRIAYPHFENPEFVNKIKHVRQEVGQRVIDLTIQSITLLRHGATVIGYSVLLWSFGPWVIGVMVASAIPPFLLEIWFGRTSFELQRANIERTRKSFYLEWLLTAEQNVKEIKLLGLGPWLLERHRSINEGYNKEEASLAAVRGRRAVFLSFISYAALYATYAYIVIRAAGGGISLGSMTLYLMVLQQGQLALNNALLALAKAYEHNLFIAQLFEFLAIPSEQEAEHPFDPAAPAQQAPPEIEFRGVSFRYPGTTRDALHNVNLTLRSGETLALIGPNGSGKTTFVKLLARLHQPTSGVILLDGQDIATLHPDQLRHRVGLIFQDFVRYQFSAGDNVGVGWLPAIQDREAIRQAIVDAEASPVVDRLSAGLDTPLGPAFGGVDLSGGQWQRLALARAFMHRGGVLVLDEPTAALDPEAETEIFQRIHDNKANRTIVLISHRLSSVRMADQIVVFENGQIIERGSHSELLADNGRYARMFREQAEGYRLDESEPSAKPVSALRGSAR
ncbi:MAG TPA: ABC transporter ATP-binding protein [Archangium sp.]|uniref:ABC transporter ATP-binding protein n=1 Tax=Archangium sp. TaxID=1872627 RepID=UPI002E3579A8|nr:ABC transporter ATP-binding protein [Archangium sp.]HEX5748111.1 ABC transporter ATP-binding protein [Archangium sp.]